MYRLRDTGGGEAQLDYVASFSDLEPLEWEARVNEALERASILVEGSEILPTDIYAGSIVAFTSSPSSLSSSDPLAPIYHLLLPMKVCQWGLAPNMRKDQVEVEIRAAELRNLAIGQARRSPESLPGNSICPTRATGLLGRPHLSQFFNWSALQAREWNLPMISSLGDSSTANAGLEDQSPLLQSHAALVASLPLFIVFLSAKTQKDISLLASHLHLPVYEIAISLDPNADIRDLTTSAVEAIFRLNPLGPWLLLGINVFGSLLAARIARDLERIHTKPCCLLLLDGSPSLSPSAAKNLIYDVLPRTLFQTAKSMLSNNEQQLPLKMERLPDSYPLFLSRFLLHNKGSGVNSVDMEGFMARYYPPSASSEAHWLEALLVSRMTISLISEHGSQILPKVRGPCAVLLTDYSSFLSPSAASISCGREAEEQMSDDSSTLLRPHVASDHEVQFTIPVCHVEDALRSTVAGPSTICILESGGITTAIGRAEVSEQLGITIRDLLSLL